MNLPRSLILLLLGSCIVRTAAAQTLRAAPPQPMLLSAGSAQQYWVAKIEPYTDGAKKTFRTLIRGQSLPAGDWKDLGSVYGPAHALAESQGELAILMDDQTWKRLGSGGLATGPDLPGKGAILAWGTVGGALHAIRVVEGGAASLTTRPASTAPTTSPSATRPTTRVVHLTLLKFDRGQWSGVADLSANLKAVNFSLGAAGAKPFLAFTDDDGAIQTRLLVDGAWKDWGEIKADPPATSFTAISSPALQAIYTAPPQAGPTLHLKREGEQWTARPLVLPAGVSAAADRAITAAAGDEIRLVVLHDNKLQEQRYDANGAPRGTLTVMPAPLVSRPDTFFKALQFSILLGMAVVLIITIYKRRNAVPDDEKDEE